MKKNIISILVLILLCGIFLFLKQESYCILKTKIYSPRNDMIWELKGLELNNPEVRAYYIQWFDGEWSDKYTPGVNDIDWKSNDPLFTAKDGGKRRVWSYFADHNYAVTACSGKFIPGGDSFEITKPNKK